MDPIVIGRVENPEELDFELQTVELVGYTLEHKEVSETFRIRPVLPAGAQLEIIRHTNAQGSIPLPQVVAFVEECLLEEDRSPFSEFLHRSDVMIDQATVIELYRTLSEYYTARPTRPPSASASNGSATKRTTRAGARSAAARSKSSRS